MVQKYLENRDTGESRSSSAKKSGFSNYCGTVFLRFLEKRFAAAVVRAKTLYPDWGDEHLHGYSWIVSAASSLKKPLFILNERAIKIRGQSFFGGNKIRGLHYKNSGIALSHKKATITIHKSCLDSC